MRMVIESPGNRCSPVDPVVYAADDSSFDDTICPVDFRHNGQITSDTVRLQISPVPFFHADQASYIVSSFPPCTRKLD
jgi:hypothetical protein